ncbi:PCI domain-containing protein 2 [Balamuthia mandrillaris]
MSRALQLYLQQVAQATRQQDGSALASLLNTETTSTALLNDVRRERNIESRCEVLGAGYDELIASHLLSLPYLLDQYYLEAYSHCATCFNAFTRVFKDSEGNWMLPVLRCLLVNLRVVAAGADDILASRGQKLEKQEDAERVIKRCFPITMTDRSALNQSKKWGSLCIINNLFKIYFGLNNLRLCKNLIAYVTGPGFPPLEKFPKADSVTYNYFVGRLSMFHGDYKKAREELSFAFYKCTQRSPKNKRLILTYLIPCQLLAGRLPSQYLLEKYSLDHFSELIAAIRRGNLLAFNEALAKHQELFIQKGIYLILEKLKFLTYRNLFKRVFMIRNNTKLALSDFQTALSWMGVDKEKEEIECILANLIYQGYIKGYLSHKMGVLVVSANNAFPPPHTFLS